MASFISDWIAVFLHQRPRDRLGFLIHYAREITEVEMHLEGADDAECLFIQRARLWDGVIISSQCLLDKRNDGME